MKSKILGVFLVMIMVITLIDINSYAANPSIELNVEGETKIKQTDETVELILSLGDFTELQGNTTLGYQATLQYDEEMFEQVSVKGLNGWTVNYEPTTKTLIGDVDSASPNTDITKIIFVLKDNLKPGMQGNIQLNNLLLTDGDNDFSFNKEVVVTVEENAVTPEESNDEMEDGTNSTNVQNSGDFRIQGTDTDKTTATAQKLPKAGLENVFIIMIIILLISMIIFKVKSKDVKY